jgi:Tubulin-tyrosine ligase family
MFEYIGWYVNISKETCVSFCQINDWLLSFSQTFTIHPFKVASLDPLLVFYIDGYVRIGNAEYDESDFSNTRNHLTTHTFLGEEGKASHAQFNERLLEHVKENPHLQRISDPAAYVKNQFKESIGMLVDAFRDKTFQTGPPLAAEDAFEFYGADCVIDNDLDVWMIEAQDDTGMDGASWKKSGS